MKRITHSEFAKSPASYIHNCHSEPIEVTRYGKTVVYLVSPNMANLSTSFSLKSDLSINNLSTGGKDEKHHQGN